MADQLINHFSMYQYTPRLIEGEDSIDVTVFSRLILDREEELWKMEFGTVNSTDLFLLSYSFLFTSSAANVVPNILMLVTENGLSEMTDIAPVVTIDDTTHLFNGMFVLQPKANRQQSYQVKFLVSGTDSGTVTIDSNVSDIVVISSRILPFENYYEYTKVALTV
ncbi:hypothetical protein [Scale drop disease virus]|uniref:ORF_092R n=1 Tax=Scale drop disease virus TaxID=1697349 RepID=A0A0K1L6A6_9VIRU|nr:ORF_092R [Scale drop disease virus]AKU37507.1 ORF_092R [Scale drop disease virus]QLI60766.1 hypothetical protein [Scale drop disease virus]QXJ13684.1 ORF092R [Scale drop disease virus]UNH60689.1 hypothetical protein SDDV_ORF020 [Scale drop disease virus]